jgi:hypothetical protein
VHPVNILPDERRIAELTTCGGAGCVGSHAAGDVFIGGDLQIRVELLRLLRIRLVPILEGKPFHERDTFSGLPSGP